MCVAIGQVSETTFFWWLLCTATLKSPRAKRTLYYVGKV